MELILLFLVHKWSFDFWITVTETERSNRNAASRRIRQITATYLQVLLKAVLWIRNDSFRIHPYPSFSWFRIHTYPDPVLDPTWIFSNILNITFTVVFLSCKCVSLHIMTRHKLFREIFFDTKEFIFELSIFVEILSNLSVFQSSYTLNSFRILRRLDPDLEWFFRIRILLKVTVPPDPDPHPDPNPQHWLNATRSTLNLNIFFRSIAFHSRKVCKQLS